MNIIQSKKEEFRWSLQKKGKNVLNVCTRLMFGVAISGLFSTVSTEALANPTDGVVTAGSASISSLGNTTTINQASNRAIIEWGKFDIAAGETTQFIQPGKNSIALNRVSNSNQISTINGNLTANGKVLVINPNGVLIGPSGNIDVAGFIASTADTDSAAFMSGANTLQFNNPGSINGVVENQGTITINDAGLGLLVAPTVRNSGVIQGNLARLQMGAGDVFGVDLYGDGLINLALSNTTTARTIKAENAGSIVANAGKVVMTAAAANNVVNSVINTTGVIEAKGLVAKGGEIILTGAGANVTVAGTVDASGKTGGGSVKIGGDYQGGAALAEAASVEIQSGAVVDASATENGNGGLIVVWSEFLTKTLGSLLAKGGAISGNGGLVETSSEGTLNIHGGLVNTSAVNGSFGDWLLDPRDVVIRSGTNDGDDSGSGSGVLTGGGPTYNDNTATTFDIYESEIEAQSALTNIIIQARRNVSTIGSGTVTLANNSNLTIQTQNSPYDPPGPFNNEADNDGTINLSNLAFETKGSGSITITGSTGSGSSDIILGKLTAQNGNITVSTDNGGIRVNNKLTTTGTGNISLDSGSAGIETDGGNFVASAGGTITLLDNLDTNDGAVDIDSVGNITVQNIETSEGAIDLKSTTGSITTKNLTINNKQAGTSVLTLNAGTTLNVNGAIFVSNLDDNDSPSYSEASATLTAQGNVNVTGAITVKANDTDQPNFDSNATLDITSTSGNVTVGGAILVDARSDKDESGGSNNPADALAKVRAMNGTITLSNGITVTSIAENTKSGFNTYANATIDLKSKGNLTVLNGASSTATAQAGSQDRGTALTSIISTDGDVTLTGANPSARAGDGTGSGADAVSQQAYTGSLIDVTNASESGNTLDSARLIVSGVNRLNVTAQAKTKTYGASDPSLTYTYTGTFYGADGFTGALQRAAGENVGGYAITQGTLNAVSTTYSNYLINFTGATFTIDPALLTITANNQSKTYGQTFTFNGTEFGVTGTLFNGNTVTGVTLTSAGAAGTAGIGDYGIAASNAIGTGLGNYTISYVGGNFHVDPALLTLTANSQTKTYGQTFTFNGTEYTVGGTLFNGDTVTGVNLFSKGTASTAGIGDYKIGINNAVGTGLGNYEIDFVGNTLRVDPALLTITVNDQTKTYGQSFYFDGDEFTTVGLVNSDTVDYAMLSSGGSSQYADAGDYGISIFGVSGSGLNNYTINYVGGTMRVNPAALTITALDQTKEYGTTFFFNGTEYTAEGLVNDDYIDYVNLLSEGSPSGALPGVYVITPSGAVVYAGGYEGPGDDFPGDDFPGDDFPGEQNFLSRSIFFKGSATSNYVITYVSGLMTIPAVVQAPVVKFDALGRPIMSVANQSIVNDLPFEQLNTNGIDNNLSLKMASAGGTSPAALDNIEPAAGGSSPEDLENIEPAAGGPVSGGGASDDVTCANDFLDNRPCNQELQ